MPTIARQGGYGVDCVRGGLWHSGPTLGSQASRNSASIFRMGGKSIGFQLGSITSLQPRWHTTVVEVEVSWFAAGSPWLEGQNSITVRGMSLGSTTETMSLSLSLCPTPVGMGMHSSFRMTMQEPIVHVLSKIAGSFAESRLSHGQRSPQTCLQFNINF